MKLPGIMAWSATCCVEIAFFDIWSLLFCKGLNTSVVFQ
jgi:hypothetical protein